MTMAGTEEGRKGLRNLRGRILVVLRLFFSDVAGEKGKVAAYTPTHEIWTSGLFPEVGE